MGKGRVSIHQPKFSNRVAKYIEKKNQLLNTTFKIFPDGSCGFLVDGKLHDEREYLRENTPILLPMADVNYDRTKNWMRDQKSY